jgi:transposase
MIDRTTISAIAAELGVSWHTVSTIAMRAAANLIAAAGPDRLAGVGRRSLRVMVAQVRYVLP